MLRWSPRDFWASNVWEVSEAWLGHAKSKGIVKTARGDALPDEESRKALRAREERERLRDGNA